MPKPTRTVEERSRKAVAATSGKPADSTHIATPSSGAGRRRIKTVEERTKSATQATARKDRG